MCCYGCQAVAQSIVNSGMQDFYKYRTDTPARAEQIVPEFLSQLHAYDNPAVQKQFVDASGELREVALILEGIVCAACIWLNEKTLQALPGIVDVSINYSTHRARIKWDNSQLQLSDILEAISRIGYMAHPYDRERQQHIIERERKQQLRRLAVAGVLGMQIMILAVAMYTGEWWGMDAGIMQSFRWLSLALCVPLLLFSSRVFFSSAWRDLTNRRVGMDVPVALGMGIAFVASVYHTIIDQGAVYYDSVSMFTFFLLIARYFEMLARKRSAESTEALLQLTPAVATRVSGENHEQQQVIAVAELCVGDTILVKPGENIAADGIIVRGTSGLNESLVTGESLPVTRTVGDSVIGGSTNTESPLVIEVVHTGEETVLASINRLLDEAQRSKPRIALLADRIASRFVVVILLVAASVAAYWFAAGDNHWLQYTVATLVVTCPCALSLATPTALTAASGQLARLGLLPVHNHVLETLAKVSVFVFDKTGTLTQGKLSLVKTETLASLSAQQCLQIAAALEAESEHPVARSLVKLAQQDDSDRIHASDISSQPGKGISARIEARQWFIGNSDFINQHCRQHLSDALRQQISQQNKTAVILANAEQLVAVFYFDDVLRDESTDLIKHLHQQAIATVLLSGDHLGISQRVAQTVGIQRVAAELKPQDKLAYVKQLQQQGNKVAMVGDGVNDAPVLAAADVSIAMGSGSELATASADMVLISNHIAHLDDGLRLARKTFAIIKQNLGWAVAYNIIAIPAAAMGYVPPWLAAIGMSASSLIVVLNALRLSKDSE
jgi:Cu2+-exporting ATPase